jgi:hypothetical protein
MRVDVADSVDGVLPIEALVIRLNVRNNVEGEEGS